MASKAELMKQIFTYRHPEGKTASIVFQKVENKWVLLRCQFNIEGKQWYDLDDWMFLGDLSKEIALIAFQLNPITLGKGVDKVKGKGRVVKL